MEMLLMGLCVALFGTAVAAAALGAATDRDHPTPLTAQIPLVKAVTAPQFFFDSAAIPAAIPSRSVSIEVLLLQIENHVAGAGGSESFLAFPTQAQLHSKTNSPFVN